MVGSGRGFSEMSGRGFSERSVGDATADGGGGLDSLGGAVLEGVRQNDMSQEICRRP